VSPRRSFALTVAALATVIGLGACGSDSEKGSSTTAATTATTGAPSDTSVTSTSDPAATVVDTEVDSTGPATSDATTDSTGSTGSDTTEPETTEPETTVAPSTVPPTTAPDAISELPGVSPLEVTVGGTDTTRPTFTWSPPAAAASYQLVVQTADGAPLWAWTGSETSVVLGGAERAADVEGPTLAGPSRVRVYAFDAALTLVAVSSWVALPGA